MGLVSTSLLIKTAIEAALDHLRSNAWLLDDVFAELAGDPLAKTDYGWKDVDAAKRWFLGNRFLVTTPFRQDTPAFPMITVVVTSTGEMSERATLGDEGYEDTGFDPKKNAILPQLVYRQFTPKSYDRDTGIVTFPDNLKADYVVPGQYLTSKAGKAYQILRKVSDSQFSVKAGTREDFTDATIRPPTVLWNSKMERTRIAESIVLGLHAQSEPSQAEWMKLLVGYVLLRYKEAYFEGRGLELTTFSMSEIDLNPNFQNSDRVYSSFVTMSGEVETRFIKFVAPKLQSVKASIRIIDGPATPDAYLEQVQKQGWQMEADPPPIPGGDDGKTNIDGTLEDGYLEEGIDQADGSEDDQ